MKKSVRFLTMVMALVVVCAAFAPAALAVTYAPLSWSKWPKQKTSSYDTRYAYAIQRFMYDRYDGPTELKIDGKFGVITEKYVKMFQSAEDLTEDGIVGVNTWSKMYKNGLHVTVEYVGNESVMSLNADTEPLAMYRMEYARVKRAAGCSDTDGNPKSFEYNGIVKQWSVIINGSQKTIYQ